MSHEQFPDDPPMAWTSTPTLLYESPSLSILTYECAGWSVLRVAGELDIRVEPGLHRAFSGISPRIVFDLRRVTFVDASGLRLLLRGHQTAQAMNGHARVAAPSPCVRRVFAIVHLDTILPVFDTLSEALKEPDTTAIRGTDARPQDAETRSR
jgi:anti-anti-sigma factor